MVDHLSLLAHGQKGKIQINTDDMKLDPSFYTKDEVVTHGILTDHVWYETDLIMQQMDSVRSRFKRLSEVMESRHKEHLKIIDGLLHEVKKLKEELAKERQ